MGAGPLAHLATRPEASRGRLRREPASPTRDAFQRDRDRIIHSTGFRRLKHKTQVFVYHEGDYYRTRLTHSIEVSQIARSIARALGLNEDLAEAVALAHDLGHPPFGHAGEEALDRAMAPHGGFDHNAQTLRIVMRLEARYAEFDGLNLTWECLEGVAKHNGPVARPVPRALAECAAEIDLELHTHAGPEAQIAAIADDIAYAAHDIDDGLRAGLFDLDHIAEAPLAGPCFQDVAARWPSLARGRAIYEANRRLITRLVDDVIAETVLRARGLAAAAEARAATQAIASFSAPLEAELQGLKQFLFARMYRHYRVNRMMSKARRVVADLFALYMAEPEILPPEWAARAGGDDAQARAVAICDFIAGMTDRFALQEHKKLFDLTGVEV